MKSILKKTPITYNGRDGFEILIHDDSIWSVDSCDYCMYEEYYNWSESSAPCFVVHGCGALSPTYFVFQLS